MRDADGGRGGQKAGEKGEHVLGVQGQDGRHER